MRIFLIVLSFLNILMYYTTYALFDNIINLIGAFNLSPGLLNFIKILILIILGFLVGLLVMLVMNSNTSRHYFDARTFVIVGIIPAIGLLLSEGSITNFIITKYFGSDLRLTELAYYFFSRNIIWALWLGFSIGVSVRLKFEKRFKHQIYSEVVTYDSYGRDDSEDKDNYS